MAKDADNLVIYIVDDDPSVRRGLVRLMRSAGFQPTAFESGEAFLAGVLPDRPGIVLLDITMPRITGLQVQAFLNQQGIDLPVIAVSASDDEDTHRRARALGACFFLHKPVDDQALLDTIEWVTASGREAG